MVRTLKESAIPVIGFAAYSGTGKTTLLTRLLPLLADRGLRVGVVKHAHHNFDIDHPGKDSYRLRKAGASQMLIGSSQRWALMVENEIKENKPLAYYLDKLDMNRLDLILVEGFKIAELPKIEVYRAALGNPPLFLEDKNIVAVATDEPQSLNTELPVFDLNRPLPVADFISSRFLGNVTLIKRKRPFPPDSS